MLAGDLEAAERLRRAGFHALDAVGERGILSTVAAYLAETLYAEERYDEALHLTELSERYAASDDSTSQILWRTARAKVYARNGDQAQGVRLAREAVALARETDCLNLQGDALLSFAEALAAAGERDEAESARSEAVGRFEAKGNIVSAAAARRSALTGTAAPADRAS
jgi:tetratricopeptide (TPR) repeat protein